MYKVSVQLDYTWTFNIKLHKITESNFMLVDSTLDSSAFLQWPALS